MTKEELQKLVNKIGISKGFKVKKEMKVNDWIKYFCSKAGVYNIKYIPVKYKDTGILKRLIANYSQEEIQLMIDFIWDSDYIFKTKNGEISKESYGLYLLSSSWVNSIYNLSKKWKEGSLEEETFKKQQRGQVWQNGKESEVIL